MEYQFFTKNTNPDLYKIADNGEIKFQISPLRSYFSLIINIMIIHFMSYPFQYIYHHNDKLFTYTN